MCHHKERVDHDRVMELAAEWERWQRDQDAEDHAPPVESEDEGDEPTVRLKPSADD